MFEVTDKEEQVFTGFVNQLVKWSKGGETPVNGDQDTVYYLDLQKERLQKKDNEIIYGIITSMNQREMTGEETYVCPNCGAISTINRLFKGCPYCDTRFNMEDLYPKVTNHFFLRDYCIAHIVGWSMS